MERLQQPEQQILQLVQPQQTWAPGVTAQTAFWQSLVAAASPETIKEAERAYMAAVLSRATAEAHALAVEAQQRADQQAELFDFDALDVDDFGDLLADGDLVLGEFGN